MSWEVIGPMGAHETTAKNRFIDIDDVDVVDASCKHPLEQHGAASDSEVMLRRSSCNRSDSPSSKTNIRLSSAACPESPTLAPPPEDFEGAAPDTSAGAAPDISAGGGASGIGQPGRKKAKPGKRERQEMKEPHIQQNDESASTQNDESACFVPEAVWDWRRCRAIISESVATARHIFSLQLSLGALFSTAVIIFATVLYSPQSSLLAVNRPDQEMLQHSQALLKASSSNKNETSVAALQDTLLFKQMESNFDTQVFTVPRDKAREMVLSMCDLPDKVCRALASFAEVSDGKVHKKLSTPLDENQGSYVSYWMWVKDVDAGHVQVAYKAATLSYKLRDVVTYKDHVEEEPVTACETKTDKGWFVTTTSQACKQVGDKRTVTQIPVFKQTVLNPQEMALVDSMMDRMLAQKVLDSNPQRETPLSIE